jgi:exoribonuclease-2
MAAGEAAAHFAFERRIPFPYLSQEIAQDLPEGFRHPETIAQNFSLRRMLKRSQVSSYPAPHASLGLAIYSRCTSPLRRYLDLVVHQQLRAYLKGEELIGQAQMLERVGAAESITGSVNLAEWQSRRHWTLVYLYQNPDWRGEGIVVEKQGGRTRVLIPELAFETILFLKQDLPLDSALVLELQSINLPDLEANFVVV